jgi:hypothetical protein
VDTGRAEWLKEVLSGCRKSRMVKERAEWMQKEQNFFPIPGSCL